MARVTINNLKPGMTINSDVKDITGRLLLGGGTSITEKHIHVFKTWGVIEVDVAGVEEDPKEADEDIPLDAETVERAEKELSELFSLSDMSSPVMKELYRICLRNRLSSEARKRVCR